jgi:nucleotide-binding universal stress UspA family protein
MIATRTLERIVLALDFTAASREALEYAVNLTAEAAARGSVRLYLFHALPAGASLDAALGFLDLTEERAREFLARAAAKHGRAAPATIECIRPGRPAHEVAALASEVHADLIVTGTHGRTGLPWLLAGSVAEEIFRSAPCPVVVVRDGVPLAPVAGRALAAIDQSPASLAALELAARLLPGAAEIDAVRVVAGDLLASSAEAARSRLVQAVLETCPSHDPPVRTLVERGSPAAVLARRVAHEEYDLVACGTRTRSGVTRALLGSVAAALVAAARCPVLIVRDVNQQSR